MHLKTNTCTLSKVQFLIYCFTFVLGKAENQTTLSLIFTLYINRSASHKMSEWLGNVLQGKNVRQITELSDKWTAFE